MKIIKYSDSFSIDDTITKGDPLIAVISFDGTKAILSHLDDGVEHHILLSKTGHDSFDIDKYFRIIFNKQGADWTFICPPDYKEIKDKTKRICEFYKDGFAVISSFLAEIGYLVDINIPRRYKRHFDELSKE